jgi:hypothetical protein
MVNRSVERLASGVEWGRADAEFRLRSPLPLDARRSTPEAHDSL